MRLSRYKSFDEGECGGFRAFAAFGAKTCERGLAVAFYVGVKPFYAKQVSPDHRLCGHLVEGCGVTIKDCHDFGARCRSIFRLNIMFGKGRSADGGNRRGNNRKSHFNFLSKYRAQRSAGRLPCRGQRDGSFVARVAAGGDVRSCASSSQRGARQQFECVERARLCALRMGSGQWASPVAQLGAVAGRGVPAAASLVFDGVSFGGMSSGF